MAEKGNGNEDAVIGANLKKFRKAYDISRKDLAEIFHISEDAVYRIEKGVTGLSSAYAYILANELHCDMNFIFGTSNFPALTNAQDVEMTLSPKEIARRLREYAAQLDELNGRDSAL